MTLPVLNQEGNANDLGGNGSHVDGDQCIWNWFVMLCGFDVEASWVMCVSGKCVLLTLKLGR